MSTPLLIPPGPPLPAGSPASPHPALTPMAFVQAVAWAYRQRGLDPAAALATAQIAPEQLADPTACITVLQMELLCHAAMRALDDEGLGWFGRRLPWGSYGMLARASLSSPSLGLALARWCRHHGLLVDDIRLELERRGEGDGAWAELRLVPQRDLGAVQEFCTVSVLRNAHGLASWFVDTALPLQQAAFPYAPPAHAAAYAVLFPGPVVFGAPCAALRFDARLLDLPLARDEAALQQMLQRALPLQVRPYRRERQWAARVRQMLRAERPGRAHTAETLAQALHVSPRSLHRQLKDEGSSLQALKDGVRRERALALLLRTEQPVKRIAQACGFASDKSFIRAFREWTGHSPADYRQRQRSEGRSPEAPAPDWQDPHPG